MKKILYTNNIIHINTYIDFKNDIYNLNHNYTIQLFDP